MTLASFTELIFPTQAIPALIAERGSPWQKLLATSAQWAEASLELTALSLMLARLNNCTTCTTNSYRAMQGCEACTKQTLKRFRGSDEDLLQLYDTARVDVARYLETNEQNTDKT